MYPNTLLLATNLNIGMQTEWMPLTQWNDFMENESLVHPLSKPTSGITPWLTLERADWRLRGSVSPERLQFRSTTSSNQETYTLGTLKGSVALDRIYHQQHTQWNVGVGIGYCHPLWSLQSSAFTEEEQASFDAQNGVTNAQIRGLNIHLPISISTQITEQIDLGIGITYHWTMQYTTSDTERQFTHYTYPMPSIYLRL